MAGNFGMQEMNDTFMRFGVSNPLIHWMNVQREVYSRMGEMAQSWGQHRMEDAEATRDAVSRLTDSPDANQVAAIYGNLMQGAMERAAHDMSDMVTHSQAIWMAGMSGARDIQNEAMSGAREVQNEAVSGARQATNEAAAGARKVQNEAVAAGQETTRKVAGATP